MTYEMACLLRVQAEKSQDAGEYEQAAGAFDELGMEAAAERCRERAAHYRDVR